MPTPAVILILLMLFVLFLLRPRKPSHLQVRLRGAAEYVSRQTAMGVPIEEAQRKARKLYGLDYED